MAELQLGDITVTPFDNEISILHKWGSVFNQPIKYILVRAAEPEDTGGIQKIKVTKGLAFEPIANIITTLYRENNTLPQIFQRVSELAPHLNMDELILLIYDTLLKLGVGQPQELLPHINQIYSVTQARRLQQRETEIQRGGDKENERRTPTAQIAPAVRFETVEQLEDASNNWVQQYNTLLDRDREALERIETIHATLEEREPLRVSPIKVDGVTVSVSPTIGDTGNPVVPDDGIDIFNDSVPSTEIPYIQYNTDENPVDSVIRNKYYKIYRGETSELTPNYNKIIPSPIKVNKKNMIYLTVWTDEDDVRKANKDSYSQSQYDLETNRLLITSPITETQNEDVVIDRVASALPTINLGRRNEVKILGEFYIYDFEISDYSLYDMILNNDLLNTYLYVDEINKSYASKKRLGIRYKSLLGDVEEGDTSTGEGYITNFSSVNIKLKQFRAPETNSFLEMTPTGPVKITLPAGTPYVQVRISRADSRDVANQFVEVFRRLMSIYKQNRTSLDDFYRLFIPSLIQGPAPEIVATPLPATVQPGLVTPTTPVPTTCRVGPGAPARKTGETKIDRLKELAPDLFVNGYARKCQCHLQPIIIGPDEVETWKARTFVDPNNQLVDRQIMEFPRDNVRFLFVCPDDKNPYPGVKANKDLSNKDLYPYIPCCFRKNQMDPTTKSKYNQYYRGIKKETPAQAKTGHKIRGNRILEMNRVGSFPKHIEDLIRRYSEEVVDIVRMGVPRSVNSLIHCVLMALDVPDYMRLATAEEKEEYTIRVRQHILGAIQMAIFKQELYDFTGEEIQEQIADPTNFFDPQLYYRSLEELFNINIYTFVPASAKEEETGGHLEIPRHKVFHSRPQRAQRPTVVIYKHLGATSDALDYPQCELIVDYDEENRTAIKVFGLDMTELLHSTLLATMKTITWSIQSPPESESPNDLVARANIYSLVDFYFLTGRRAKSQILDDYGKMRGLIFPTVYGDMTMSFPSSQPENLPIATDPVIVSVENAVEVFGEPAGITITPDQMVNGLWYTVMDIMFGVYVPIQPTKRFFEKVVGPPNPISTSGVNAVNRTRNLYRTLDFILQLVRWLFVIAQVTATIQPNGTRIPVLPEEFASQYFAVDTDPPFESATYYQLQDIPRKLPVVNSVEAGINIMSPLAPTLFRDQRIIMYNQNFSDKIIGKLQEFYLLASPLPITPIAPDAVGADWKIPTELEGIYSDASDFRQQPSVAIFVGERDLATWLASINRPSYSSILIKDKLDISYGLLDEPYIYLSPDGKIYLIQNVQGGSFVRAITVAYLWLTNKINMGPQAPPYTADTPVNVVYTISPAGTASVQTNNSMGSPVYLQLLLYGEGFQLVREQGKVRFTREGRGDETNKRYAAMLPLL